MNCPICDGQTDLQEQIRPRLNEDGMMIPVPCRYLVCKDCGFAFASREEINFNATQAHLALNQYCLLEDRL